MSDNDELKEVAKKLIRIGMEVGKPVAKKVLESETGKTLMTLGIDMAVDIMSGVTDKLTETRTITPPKPWNKMTNEEIEELGKELQKKNPTLGLDLAVDIMSGVAEKMAKPKTVTPPKPWDLIEEIEEMSKELELRKKDPTLAEKLSKVPGEEKNETK